MLSWCSYCQEFLKEVSPYGHLVVTHGMCEACAKRGLDIGDAAQENLDRLVSLQKELYEAGLSGDHSKIDELIEKCKRIGVKPLDMVFGLLNPMLVEIGNKWEQGLISVREEHQFTEFAENILHAIQRGQTHTGAQSKFVVLLASAEGNYHTFGLKLVHLWLRAEGFSSELIAPSVPMRELTEYTLKFRPLFVGISVSLRAQLPGVQAYLKSIVDELGDHAPRVLLGGYAVKSGLVLPAEAVPAILVRDIKRLPELLEK